MKDTKKVESTTTSAKHMDVIINDMLKDYLAPFHAYISAEAMTAKDARLDLACDKIGQAMTALNERSRMRLKEGKYGKDS